MNEIQKRDNNEIDKFENFKKEISVFIENEVDRVLKERNYKTGSEISLFIENRLDKLRTAIGAFVRREDEKVKTEITTLIEQNKESFKNEAMLIISGKNDVECPFICVGYDENYYYARMKDTDKIIKIPNDQYEMKKHLIKLTRGVKTIWLNFCNGLKFDGQGAKMDWEAVITWFIRKCRTAGYFKANTLTDHFD